MPTLSKIALALFVMLFATPSWATTYWVSVAGGGAACTDADGDADPGVYLTPTLLDSLNCPSAGDTVIFKAGTYTATINWNTLTVNGTASAQSVYRCEGNQTCILRPSAMNSGQTGIIYGANKDYLTIGGQNLGFEIDGTNIPSPSSTVVMGVAFTSNDTTDHRGVNVYGNHIHHYTYNGASFARSTAGSRTTTYINGAFEWNTIGTKNTTYTDTEAHHGIYNQTKGYTVRHNDFTITNNVSTLSSFGIHCYPICESNTIEQNIIRGSGTRGDGILVQGATNTVAGNVAKNTNNTGTCLRAFGSISDNNVFYHNICHGHATWMMVSTGATGNVATNNVCVTGGGCATSGTFTSTTNVTNAATTHFVDHANYNYSLVAGSTLINAGTAIVGRNYNGSAPDQGPFETFVIASAEVGTVDATSLILTFTNNLFPPLLPLSGITGITVRENTTPVTVSSCARTGDNIVDCTLAASITNGTTVDWSYAQTGNLTDSSLVGGTVSQELLAVTNSSVTNNVGAGAPTYVFSQARYEFHGKYGTEAAPVIKPDGVAATGAAENFSNMSVVVGGSIRVRFAVTCTTADCPAAGFLPRYSKNGGAYTVVPDAFATDNIAFCGVSANPDVPTNGTATTDQLSTSGTFVAGAFVLTSNAIPTVDLALNGKTELEYCFAWDTDATATDYYDIRLYNQDGSTITYTVTPRITLSAPAGGVAELWDLLMLTMLPILGRIDANTAKPSSNFTVGYPSVDVVTLECPTGVSLKTSGTGLKRTVTCVH